MGIIRWPLVQRMRGILPMQQGQLGGNPSQLTADNVANLRNSILHRILRSEEATR